MRSIICALLLSTAAASAGTDYHAISLEGGGHVVLRHGSTARVDFVKGEARYTDIRIEDGALRIDNCRVRCPRGYEMELAITAPGIDTLSVRDGGAIEALGEFPEQEGLSVAVAEGGAVDSRALAARNVTASVRDGGGVYTAARETLTASVSHGGHISYWGAPKVRQSVSDGGVVSQGRVADARKPLADLRPKLAVIPPLPAIPAPPQPPQPPG